MICLQPLAAQEKGEYPGESPTAPVPGAPSPEQPAAEEKPTASAGVDILSQYIWRGFALSRDSAVFQPSVTVGYKGFSFNVWGNLDSGENAPAALTTRKGLNWNQTDFTVGYSREIFKTDWLKALTLNVGCIYYAYDKTLYPQGDAFELYYGLVADFNIFKIGVQGNTEVFHYPGNWLTVGISRVFDLPWHKMTLELGNNYIFLFSRDFVALSGHAVFQSGQFQVIFRTLIRASLCYSHYTDQPVYLDSSKRRLLVWSGRQFHPITEVRLLGRSA